MVRDVERAEADETMVYISLDKKIESLGQKVKPHMNDFSPNVK